MGKLNHKDYDIYGIDPEDYKIDPEDYDFHPDENEKHDPHNEKELANRIDNSCYVDKHAHDIDNSSINSNKPALAAIGMIFFFLIVGLGFVILMLMFN